LSVKRKFKILVFENDPFVVLMFKSSFILHGHDVLIFSDPTACPLLSGTQCACHEKSWCADVLIANIKMPHMGGIEFFEKQRKQNCKIPDENKLLLGDVLTSAQQSSIDDLGCHFMKTSVNTTEISQWLDGCAKRVFGTS